MQECIVYREGYLESVEPSFLDIIDISRSSFHFIVKNDIDALTLFAITCHPKKEGYSYKELAEFIEIEDLERALDLLLDIGLLSAKWKKIGSSWERRFHNSTEISSHFEEYDYRKLVQNGKPLPLLPVIEGSDISFQLIDKIDSLVSIRRRKEKTPSK